MRFKTTCRIEFKTNDDRNQAAETLESCGFYGCLKQVKNGPGGLALEFSSPQVLSEAELILEDIRNSESEEAEND